MNVLDENIPKSQRERLERWRLAVRQIGVGIGRKAMLDDEIITLLHTLRHPTFLTRDDDFYKRQLCHPRYCIVYLAVEKSETAWFTRRVLHHPEFNTQAKRMGKVIRVSRAGISLWRQNESRPQQIEWK
jgi:hypothetical protein